MHAGFADSGFSGTSINAALSGTKVTGPQQPMRLFNFFFEQSFREGFNIGRFKWWHGVLPVLSKLTN